MTKKNVAMRKPKGSHQNSEPVTIVRDGTYTIPEIRQMIIEGKSLPIPFGDFEELYKFVRHLASFTEGYKFLVACGIDVPKTCYEVFINPDTNPTQRTRQVYDIARFSIIPHMLIGLFGSNPLPKELQNWNPIFGRNWFMASMKEVKDSDTVGNMYWHWEAELLYQKHSKKLTAPRVRELMIQILDNNQLLIKRDGSNESIIKRFEDIPVLWDNKSNVVGTIGHMLIDLSNSIDGCLSSHSKHHKTFGKGAKDDQSQSHISQLSKALDGIIPTIDQERKGVATKRWFIETGTTYRKWKPKFKFVPSRSVDELEMASKILNRKLTTTEYAEQKALKHQGLRMVDGEEASILYSNDFYNESKDYRDTEVYDSSEILD